jgi:hypothetical protein
MLPGFRRAGFCRWLTLVVLIGAGAWHVAASVPAGVVLVEAEQFEKLGGWVVDQQFMDQMGSPYLLAHGLGDPVRDAETTVQLPAPGRYHVWVRTRDWVAPWKVRGAPGKFQLLLDGKALPVTFGTEGVEWHWQDGGTIEAGSKATLTLHDLTGFEGRCDAVLFSSDPKFRPPNKLAELTTFRREALHLPEQPADGGKYDLVVVGGGIAGTCAAVGAARLGLKVALVQDRPVLGGNGSSEVRVWPEGKVNQEPYPRIGDLVSELVAAKGPGDGNAKTAEVYDDERKLRIARAEPNLTMFLEQRVDTVETSGGRITGVVAQHIRSAQRTRLTGRLFADCTGDAAVGFGAGAASETTREQHMGASNLWRVERSDSAEPFPRCLCPDTNALNTAYSESEKPAPFPRCPWAVDLSKKPFPGRPGAKEKAGTSPPRGLGEWFWESGFDRDPIADVEWMRDLNLRAMYGAWDTLKNVDRLYPNHKLSWAAYIAGKRESRRLLGEVMLTADDFRTNHIFPDAAFPCSWGIDLHTPDPRYQRGHEGAEFIAQFTHGGIYDYKGPFWAPYRCLYSRNVSNLFMAGRDISVSHDGLGAVRVMRTCGTMGEVVAMAALVCNQKDCTPAEVYRLHLDELKHALERGVGKTRQVAP